MRALIALGLGGVLLLAACGSEPRHNADCLHLNIALVARPQVPGETATEWAMAVRDLIERQGVGKLTIADVRDLVRQCHGS